MYISPTATVDGGLPMGGGHDLKYAPIQVPVSHAPAPPSQEQHVSRHQSIF